MSWCLGVVVLLRGGVVVSLMAQGQLLQMQEAALCVPHPQHHLYAQAMLMLLACCMLRMC